MVKKLPVKLLSLVVALLMAAIPLSACSSAAPTGAPAATSAAPSVAPTETATAAPTEAAATATPEPTKAPEAVKIVYWMFGNPTNDADQGLPKDKWYITGAISRFEAANPGITVELLVLPQDGLGDKFKAAGVAQNGPDICNLWVGSMLVDNKQFIEPLDSYFTQAEKDSFGGLDSCRENYNPGGPMLGVPNGNDYLMMFYNKAMFKAAGIDDSAIPTDMPSLEAACQKIKATGKTPILIGNKEGWHAAFFLNSLFANAAGEQGIRDILDGRTTYAASPYFVTACKAWQDLYAKGYVNKDAASLDDSSSQTKFTAGGGAMVFVGQWLVSSALAVLKDDLGMAKIPSLDPASPNAGSIMGGPGQCFVVTSYSKHKDEAVKFLKFLISKQEVETSIQQTSHGTGSTPFKYVSPDVFTDPFSKQLQEFSTTSTIIPWFDNQMPADVASEFYRLSSLMLTGKMTAEDFAAKLDEATSKVSK